MEHLKSKLRLIYRLHMVSATVYDLDNLDITTQLPQDIIDTLLEGVVQYELRPILSHWKFTLAQLNAAICI